MSLSKYNRIFNLSLGIIVLYNIICLADIFLSSVDLVNIIRYSAVIYLLYAVGMLAYKIRLTGKYFFGNDSVYNLIAHGVLTLVSFVLILIIIF